MEMLKNRKGIKTSARGKVEKSVERFMSPNRTDPKKSFSMLKQTEHRIKVEVENKLRVFLGCQLALKANICINNAKT